MPQIFDSATEKIKNHYHHQKNDQNATNDHDR